MLRHTYTVHLVIVCFKWPIVMIHKRLYGDTEVLCLVGWNKKYFSPSSVVRLSIIRLHKASKSGYAKRRKFGKFLKHFRSLWYLWICKQNPPKLIT